LVVMIGFLLTGISFACGCCAVFLNPFELVAVIVLSIAFIIFTSSGGTILYVELLILNVVLVLLIYPGLESKQYFNDHFIVRMHFYPILVLIFFAFFCFIVIRAKKKFYNSNQKNKFKSVVILAFIMLLYLLNTVVILSCFTYCQFNMKNFATILEKFHQDKEKYPSSLDELKLENTSKLPVCSPKYYSITKFLPAFSSTEIEILKISPYLYEVSDDLQYYTIRCQNIRNHEIFAPPGYPIYNSKQGLVTKPQYYKNIK
jgi:hypothetical protein